MAKDAPLDWFPFNVVAWLTSETARCMGNAARGVYIDLLARQWRDGSIPADVARLARLCGETADSFAAIWEEVGLCFTELDGDSSRLINLRLEQDRTEQDQARIQKSEAGKRGMAKRWAKSTTGSQAESASEPIADDNTAIATNNTVITSDNEKEKEKEKENISILIASERTGVIETLIRALPGTHRTPEVETAIRRYGTMRAENAVRDAVGWRPWGITAAETLAVQWGKHPILALLAALENATANQWKNLRFEPESVGPGRSRASPPPQESAEQRAKRRLEQAGIRQ
jgi:uncharacterized protein YdaU (DUF1376 family)